MKKATPLFLFIFLLSCSYPEKKVLIRFADGRPKVIRYYKHGDSLNEKLISYYSNGKKEYVKYWLNDLDWKFKEYEWYESGAKKSVMINQFKDTVRTYNPADSSIRVKGLVKRVWKVWYEDGKIEHEEYPENGEIAYLGYQKDGEVNYKRTKRVRPDGYDSIETYWYVRPKRK